MFIYSFGHFIRSFTCFFFYKMQINELLQPFMNESLTWMAKMNLTPGLFKKDKSQFVLIELIICII